MSREVSIFSIPPAVLRDCILSNLVDNKDIAACKQTCQLFLKTIANNPSVTRRFQQQYALAHAKQEAMQVSEGIFRGAAFGKISVAAADAGLLQQGDAIIDQVTTAPIYLTEVMIALARYQARNGPVSAAHETATQLNEFPFDPSRSKAHFEIIKELLSLGKIPDAEETLLMIEDPVYLRQAYCAFAHYYVKQDNPKKATELLQKADDVDALTHVHASHKDALLLEIGQIHGSLGNLEAAKACFNRMQTEGRPAYHNQEEVVRIHAEAGCIAEAEEVIKDMSEKGGASCLIVEAHVRAGNFDQAKRIAKDLDFLDADTAFTLIAKGEAAAGRFEEAKQTVRSVQYPLTIFHNAYLAIALAQGAAGFFNEAEVTVREMYSKGMFTNSAEAFFKLAKIAAHQKNGAAERQMMKLAKVAVTNIQEPEDRSAAYLALLVAD